jgi:hypothetical protein
MEGQSTRSEFSPEKRLLTINRRHRDFRMREADVDLLEEYVFLLLCMSLASPVLGNATDFENFLGLVVTLHEPTAQMLKSNKK